MTDRESNASSRAQHGSQQRRDEQQGAQQRDEQQRRDEIDRMALESPKSDWVSSTDPAAGDPITPAERNAQDLLGHKSVRDAALEGPGGLDDSLADQRDASYERRPVQGGKDEDPPTIDEVENREERR